METADFKDFLGMRRISCMTNFNTTSAFFIIERNPEFNSQIGKAPPRVFYPTIGGALVKIVPKDFTSSSILWNSYNTRFTYMKYLGTPVDPRREFHISFSKLSLLSQTL